MKLRTLASVLVLPSAVVAHAAPPVDLDAALRQWLGDSPGGVAAAWIDAEGVTFANAGQFAAADARPITADTYFEIGSLTKPFTGLLLADTVAQGTVKLADPVGAPFGASSVTFRQLVTHTAGLPRMAKDPSGARSSLSLEGLVSAFDEVAPRLAPSKSSYSNFGFAVLGQALAAQWGKSYGDVLRERVLTPLGLNDTSVDWHTVDARRLAPGHADGQPVANVNFKAYAPAGALISTTRELARFVQANLGLVDTPLNALLATTHQPLADGEVPIRKIGHAWIIETRGPDTVIWHNGATDGYRSFLVFNPAKKTGLVLLTNTGRGAEAAGFALLAGRMPPAPRKLPAEVKLTAEQLGDYVGVYSLGPVEFTVTLEGEALSVQLTGQQKLRVFAAAADKFFLKTVPAEISFERDAAGKVSALVLHQGGRDQRAARK